MDLRLAYNPGPINAYGALAPMTDPKPDVRLAFHPEANRTLSELDPQTDAQSPTVRLAATTAMMNTAAADATGPHRYPMHNHRADGGDLLRPALLVSYVYLDPFLKRRHLYAYRDWVLDSGAYSAYNSGVEIKLQDYIDTCKRLADEDKTLTEVFALDVIGDWKASLKNCREMWRQGVEAIPAFHPGEPESALKGIAADYPKIALGGVVGWPLKKKIKFVEQCFARVYPCRIHGFGMAGEKILMRVPFHSTDATNWEMGPCAFGRWQAFGQLSVRGGKQNLRAEVEWYLALEQRCRDRWKVEMDRLDAITPPVGPKGGALRLAQVGTDREPWLTEGRRDQC